MSVENQVPEDLYDAMRRFISAHPDWDQYRLMQSAVVQHSLNGLFQRSGVAGG